MTVMGRATLTKTLVGRVRAASSTWGADGRLGRVWLRDGSVWTGRDEGQWLGWLDVPEPEGPVGRRLSAFVDRLRRDGMRTIALLGMGGSSLFPDMLRQLPGGRRDLDLHVVDSTDPAQIRTCQSALDLDRTVFIVSSKSGTTLETRLLARHFYDTVVRRVGTAVAASRFCAITDAGSALDRHATEHGYRAVFHGDAAVGGRFSALTYFGLVPAAVRGFDVETVLRRARHMAASCGPSVPPADNPGVQLGLLIGLAAQAGRDKLTVVTSPGLRGLAAWIEQLVAESTGKDGVGVIPVDGECLAPAECYRADRLFVAVRLADEPDPAQESALDVLAEAGHPVVRFELPASIDVGAECFRWEFATAVAGAVLRVHPFDQPDVEAAKVAARRMIGRDRPRPTPAQRTSVQVAYDTGTLELSAAGDYGRTLRRRLGAEATAEQWLAAHFQSLDPGDYVALLAYVPQNAVHQQLVGRIRHRVREVTGAATTVGFGPRYLHSTGQAHKGGPNSGLFLLVTGDDHTDIDIPDESSSFRAVELAQAAGDAQVLAERGRRCLRLHLDGNVEDGLESLAALIVRALDTLPARREDPRRKAPRRRAPGRAALRRG